MVPGVDLDREDFGDAGREKGMSTTRGAAGAGFSKIRGSESIHDSFGEDVVLERWLEAPFSSLAYRGELSRISLSGVCLSD